MDIEDDGAGTWESLGAVVDRLMSRIEKRGCAVFIAPRTAQRGARAGDGRGVDTVAACDLRIRARARRPGVTALKGGKRRGKG